jgi:hypothetical protein
VLPVVAMTAAGCASTAGRPGDGLKLVTPLAPAAAVCLAEADAPALKRILGNDEMIRRSR